MGFRYPRNKVFAELFFARQVGTRNSIIKVPVCVCVVPPNGCAVYQSQSHGVSSNDLITFRTAKLNDVGAI